MTQNYMSSFTKLSKLNVLTITEL